VFEECVDSAARGHTRTLSAPQLLKSCKLNALSNILCLLRMTEGLRHACSWPWHSPQACSWPLHLLVLIQRHQLVAGAFI